MLIDGEKDTAKETRPRRKRKNQKRRARKNIPEKRKHKEAL